MECGVSWFVSSVVFMLLPLKNLQRRHSVLQSSLWSSIRCPLTPFLRDMVSVLSGGMNLPLMFVMWVGIAEMVSRSKVKGQGRRWPDWMLYCGGMHSDGVTWRLTFYSASALLAVRPSVRPSVCPYVTFRYCLQTNEDTIVRFSASGRTIPLVSGEVKFIQIFLGDHPQRVR